MRPFSVVVILGLSIVATGRADPVVFEKQIIAVLPDAYQVSVADMNGDGRVDAIGLAEERGRGSALYWYESPTWTPHRVEAPELVRLIDVAPEDVDGDGRVDLVVATAFDLRAPASGAAYWLTRGKTGERWAAHKISDEATAHRVRWLDADGDGRRELLVAPMIGGGPFDHANPRPARAAIFARPADPTAQPWPRTTLDDTLPVLHGVRIFDWDGDRRDEILTASYEGVHLFRLERGGWTRQLLATGDQQSRPKRGSSDVAVGTLPGKRRFLVTIEPWHGHQIVMYTPGRPGAPWRRRLLDDTLSDGHVLQTADFDGDGHDEIVAGCRGTPRSLLLYTAADAAGREWTRTTIDYGDMGAAGSFIVDLDGDGRKDIVAGGTPTANVKWYRNLGRPR